MSYYDYYEVDTDYGKVFNDAMSNFSGVARDGVVKSYDFSRFKTIVDVGGGHGFLLAAILKQAKKSRGLVFDKPSVVAGARALLEAEGVADRCTIQGGSFFEEVPQGGDAYLMKNIMHN